MGHWPFQLLQWQVCENFEDMDQREELFGGSYAHIVEEPSPIQQRVSVPCIKVDVTAQPQTKTATFSTVLLQKTDTGLGGHRYSC